MANEIVLYKPDESVQLEVRLEDDTVWLTQQQMAELFQKDISVISRHIKNAFAEGELDEKSNLHFLQVPNSDRPARLYDLDVIISVGYRVKSQRGTQFRRWASRVLKEYMLKGYAVNQRLLVIEDRMDRRLQEHTEQIHELQEKIDFFVRTNMPPAEQIFFEGEFFEARVLLEKLIKMAKKRVIIIDGYIDAATFEMLDVRAKGVTADIYSDGEHKSLRDMHNADKGKQPVNTHKWSKSSHDRWVIIDDTLYHCGHSVKDLGKKLSAIMRMDWDPETVLKEVR